MMKTASQVDRSACPERHTGSRDRAPGHQTKAIRDGVGPGNLQLCLLCQRQRSGPNLL